MLSRLGRIVEDQLGEVCPRLPRLEEFASFQGRLFDIGIGAARDLAWAPAKHLVAAPRGQWEALIAGRQVTA